MARVTKILLSITIFTLLASLSNVRATSIRKCPADCYCDLDHSGRIYTECNEPSFNEFKESDFDSQMEVIIIRDPKYQLTIGPVFNRFRMLETLKITGANIPAIGTRSFWGVKSLRTLDLSNNNITIINQENFYDQKNLVELNLASNRIGRVPSGTFSYLEVWECCNRIRTEKIMTFLLQKLKILKLSDNSLEELFPSTFQGLSRLHYLDLSENRLNDLTPSVFRDFKVNFQSISQFRFITISMDVNCDYISIPFLFSFLPFQSLLALKCRNCHLKSVSPQLYSMLEHLTELDLGQNQVNIPCSTQVSSTLHYWL